MSFIFITFGDSVRYKNSITKICEEAKNCNIFDKIIPYDETKLDASFIEKHQEFLKNNKRGYGYWLWKPQVLLQTLRDCKDGDTILYADAGCRINKEGLNRLNEYRNICENSENKNLSFPLAYYFTGKRVCHNEVSWTKGDVLALYNLENKEPAQLVGGIFLVTKCPHIEKMVETWLKLGENYHNIDDTSSILPNHPLFREHRHDQSLWSIIRKEFGTEIMESDETYHINFNENLDKPIHAIRR